MARVPDLAPTEQTPEQAKIFNEIAGPRGGVVRGPFAIWLRNPEVADKANQLGNALRVNGKLDKRLFELAILVVARAWTAQYEWFAHAEAALAAGLEASTIEALQQGREPALSRADERIVYQVSYELQVQHKVSDATYAEAEKALGLPLLIELISVVGFYTMVAIVLNGFEAPVPGGAVPLSGTGFASTT
ncbi:MAG: carboxymuconolactone decarboxylase family protein [Pseudomonadota bacterium]